MRTVTYRTFPDGTQVMEVITTTIPVVRAVIEPDDVPAAA